MAETWRWKCFLKGFNESYGPFEAKKLTPIVSGHLVKYPTIPSAGCRILRATYWFLGEGGS